MTRTTTALLLFLTLVPLSVACGDGGPQILEVPASSPRLPGSPSSLADSDLPSSVTDTEASKADGPSSGSSSQGGRYAIVRITWDGAAPDQAVNLDLHMVDPSGSHVYYLSTTSTDDTARFGPHDECISFDCEGDEENPSEAIFWLRDNMKPGQYEVWVENVSDRAGSFEIDIDVPGTTSRETVSIGANAESSRWVFEVEDDSGDCYSRLERRGVSFDRISISEGSCAVEDAVMVNGPVNGVTYRVSWARSTTRFRTSCETALAIYDSAQMLRQHDIDTVYHMGSYECRNKRGGSSLSQHGLGRAMDYAGFKTTSGTEYSVVRHWEHNTSSPTTTAGRVLRQIATGLEGYFDEVLDADFNSDHDNHFHAELSGR